MKSLTIIGAGNLGQTMAKLWLDAGVFSMGAILNSTMQSSREAARFIGAGRAAEGYQDLRKTDVWMIATPDDYIASCCTQLANSGVLKEGDLVFHTSGAHTSANLGAAWAARATTASLHPIKSFVDPHTSVQSFAGTYCTFEGSDDALDILKPATEAIDGVILQLEAANKPLYHAGTSILCNYLCALVDFGLTALDQSGIERDTAIKAVQPILRETMENILKLGSTGALTGPIARGDIETVRKQVNAIHTKMPDQLDLFRTLGLLATDISKAKGAAPADNLSEIRNILCERRG